jgi:hypothetical protein
MSARWSRMSAVLDAATIPTAATVATARRRVAVVLFNLGGPDRPEALKPFLLNLFSDPAILRVPFFVRPFLARVIARARVKPASENYALLGGKSPLLELTRDQAAALQAALAEPAGDTDTRCFIAMRYWHPFSDEAARAVRDFRPDRGRPAAALPAVLHHHDRQLADRVARSRRPRRPGGRDRHAVLLPHRRGLCPRHRRGRRPRLRRRP